MARERFWVKAAGLAGLAAVVAVAFIGCGGKQSADSDWPADGKPRVVVSFAPLYCFAANVAGDDAHVKNVMTTTGPHDFDPTADHVRLVTKADLMLIVGMELDDVTGEKMQKGSGNANLKLVKLGDAIPKNMRCEGFCTHANHGPEHKHGDDPHVWLGPDHAVLLVNKIRDTLKEQNPAHADGYDARAAAYVKKLGALKAYGEEKFAGKKDNRLVSFHDSLAYFAECYRLDIRDVVTPKAGQEPDAAQMKRIIEKCTSKRSPTRVITVEPQYSTSGAGATLVKELAAKGVKNPVLVEIDTLETVKPDDLTLDWYEKRMRANIDALAAALE